jgi:hypothetical protein
MGQIHAVLTVPEPAFRPIATREWELSTGREHFHGKSQQRISGA